MRLERASEGMEPMPAGLHALADRQVSSACMRARGPLRHKLAATNLAYAATTQAVPSSLATTAVLRMVVVMAGT